MRAPASAGELAERLDEAKALRESMLVCAEALAHHGLVDAQRVREIRAGSGNIDLANDCGALNALFAQAWPEIGARRAPSAQKAPGGPSDRARAFTLMARAYDQCRRAVTYLRWDEGDASGILPALTGPRTRRTRDDAAPAPAVTPDAPIDEPQPAPRPS